MQKKVGTAPAGKRQANLRTGIAISALTVALCVGLLEVVALVWERDLAQGPLGWTLVASRRMPLTRHGAPGREYTLQREGEYLWSGIPVRIGAHGLRDDAIPGRKALGTHRILNVGDSVAFGWAVRREDTYGAQLERLLNRDGGGSYEVVNAGVPGWTVAAERNFLLQEGLAYEPDTVLWEITVVNDIRGSGGPRRPPRPAVIRWLRDHTYFWPFLTTQGRFLLAGHRGPEAIPVLNPIRRAGEYYPLDEESRVWDEVWAPIADAARACAERGIRFMIAVFPTAFQLHEVAHPDVPQRILGRRAAAAGIAFVDLLPTYRAACRHAPEGACEGYQNFLFADVWMHPNPRGHRLAAEALAEALASMPPGA